MTVKEASKKFGLNPDLIRTLCRESQKGTIGYINAIKLNGRWIINDSVEIILTKSQIQNILFQIIKYKNNSNAAISRKCFSTDEILKIAIDHLYKLGFVTKYNEKWNTMNELFDSLMITEEGLTYLINNNSEEAIKNVPEIKVFNFDTKVGVVVV